MADGNGKRPTVEGVVTAARALDRALDETVEGALWLDRKASSRVYRARCRLSRALYAFDVGRAHSDAVPRSPQRASVT